MKKKSAFVRLSNYPDYELFESYEVNSEGVVRNIETHEVKRIFSDSKGRPMITFYYESGRDRGRAKCIYLNDLLHDVFGTPLDELNESYKDSPLMKSIEEAKRKASEASAKSTQFSTKPQSSKRKRTLITCEDTGETFNGYTDAAKAFGFNYDKFYNTFYELKKDEIVFEGKTFKRS